MRADLYMTATKYSSHVTSQMVMIVVEQTRATLNMLSAVDSKRGVRQQSTS